MAEGKKNYLRNLLKVLINGGPLIPGGPQNKFLKHLEKNANIYIPIEKGARQMTDLEKAYEAERAARVAYIKARRITAEASEAFDITREKLAESTEYKNVRGAQGALDNADKKGECKALKTYDEKVKAMEESEIYKEHHKNYTRCHELRDYALNEALKWEKVNQELYRLEKIKYINDNLLEFNEKEKKELEKIYKGKKEL